MKKLVSLALFLGFQGLYPYPVMASSQIIAEEAKSHMIDQLASAYSLERGQLISAQLVKKLTIKDILANPKLERALSNRQLVPKNGIQIFNVTFQTKSPKAPIVASGVILVPDPMPSEAPVISLQHGTLPDKSSAPSKSPYEGLFEASLGFVTLVQDYIGYGVTENLMHPYIIAESYADSGVDFLKASHEFAYLHHMHLGKLFLKGYSEGGYATLSLQRELETHYADAFPIEASAPSAGPFQLQILSEILLAKERINPFLIPYLLLSYKDWFPDDNLSLDEIFRVKTEKIQRLFNGKYSGKYIYLSLPKQTNQLFDPEFSSDFLLFDSMLPSSIALKKVLTEQSINGSNWSPRSKTRFYHCQDDEVIPVASLLNILKEFKGNPNISEPVLYTTKPDETPYTHITCPGLYDPTLEFLRMLKL